MLRHLSEARAQVAKNPGAPSRHQPKAKLMPKPSAVFTHYPIRPFGHLIKRALSPDRLAVIDDCPIAHFLVFGVQEPGRKSQGFWRRLRAQCILKGFVRATAGGSCTPRPARLAHPMQQCRGAATRLVRGTPSCRPAACIHYDATSSDVEALLHENLVSWSGNSKRMS